MPTCTFLAQELTKHGIDLKEVRVVSDDAPAIEAAVKALSDAHDTRLYQRRHRPDS